MQGSGGTVASTAFGKVADIIDERFDPSRFNIYVFYASDGANFRHDRESASHVLSQVAGHANYMGYVETVPNGQHSLTSETAALFQGLIEAGAPAGRYALSTPESVWEAIRAFFTSQATAEE